MLIHTPKSLFEPWGLLRLCIIMLLFTLTSCDRSTSKDSKDNTSGLKETVRDTSNSKEMVKGSMDEATLTYGYAPIPNPAVTYQPDVIFIEGGPHAIRSASADGIVWTIDGHAKGAKDLRVGSIMFATGRAVGRVARIEQRGDDIAVTLGPANLGEIIRDADIDIDVSISPDSVTYQLVPELPGIYRDLNPEAKVETPAYAYSLNDDLISFEMPFISIAAAASNVLPNLPDHLPAAKKYSVKSSVHGWEVEPYTQVRNNSIERFGFKVGFAPSDSNNRSETLPRGAVLKGVGLKFFADFTVGVRDLRVKTKLHYRDGRADPSNTTALIGDFTDFNIGLQAGVTNGAKDNLKVRIEFPIEIIYQLPPTPSSGGLPMLVQVKYKFLVEPMLSMKNGTLTANGGFKMEGPIGIDGGKVITPTVEPTKSLVETIKGISISPSGLVFATELRSLYGLGTPAFMVGLYTKSVWSFAITRGSSVGLMGSIPCNSVKFQISGGGGVGTQFSSEAGSILSKIFKKEVKTEAEVMERMAVFFDPIWFFPDIPLCRF